MLKTLALLAILCTPVTLYAQSNPYVRPQPTFSPANEATPMHVVHAMLKLANVGPQDLVCDLGSGDGRIVIEAAKAFGARALGVEFNANTLAIAKKNAKKSGVEDRIEFVFGSIYEYDTSRCTVVTLFLWPEINLKLRPKLTNELAEGASIVSFEHDMADWRPLVTLHCDDTGTSTRVRTCTPRRSHVRTPIFKWVVTKEAKAAFAKRQ